MRVAARCADVPVVEGDHWPGRCEAVDDARIEVVEDGDRKLGGDGGALILARAIDDPTLSDEILEQTRAWIDAGIGQVSASEFFLRPIAFG